MPELPQSVPQEPAPSAPAVPESPAASRPPLPWEVPAPDPSPAHATEQQAEPVVEDSPAPSEPSTTPAFDPAQIESLNQKAAQFDQLQQAIAQEQARLAREAEQQRLDEEFRSRAKQIWDISQRFDTDEERENYYLTQINALRAEVSQTYQQQVEAERQQLEAERMAQAIAGYPDWLGKEFGLDAADVEDLRQLNDFNAMTATARTMKRMKEKYAELKTIADQTFAAQQAQRLNPALNPGTLSGAPVTGEEIPKSLRAGTRESRAVLADILSGS